jgi:hypothetical protein
MIEKLRSTPNLLFKWSLAKCTLNSSTFNTDEVQEGKRKKEKISYRSSLIKCKANPIQYL